MRRLANWIPIIQLGTKTAQAWDAVDAIAQSIIARDYPPPINQERRLPAYDPVLLFGYLAAADRNSNWLDVTTTHLNLAIEEAETFHHLGMFGGLCGLGWTVEHILALLDDGDGAEPKPDLNEDTDSAVIRGLRRSWRDRPYDLISGLMGCGVYFLERMPIGAAAEGVRLVVAQLDALAEYRDDGVSWFTGPGLLPEWQRERCPNGYYNLGVAHGIPGVLYFLSEAGAAEIERRKCESLLERAMAWFIAQRRPAGSRSWYGSWIAGGVQTDTRLTWCYGDLGIVAVLLQIARRSGREDWYKFARNLLDDCVRRSADVADVGVNDAPLCHGATGVAHIFNRIYQTEGDKRCRDIAVAWFGRALAMREPGTGVGGFSASTRPPGSDDVVWEPNPAFLDGALGVALALLSAITDIDPAWDRMLLLSGRQF